MFSDFEVRIISGGLIELIGPSVDDGMAVEFIHGSHDAVLEFLFGCDADVAQHRAGELGEEALDEIEPGAVFGREGEFEAAGGLFGQPSLGLLRLLAGPRQVVERRHPTTSQRPTTPRGRKSTPPKPRPRPTPYARLFLQKTKVA